MERLAKRVVADVEQHEGGRLGHLYVQTSFLRSPSTPSVRGHLAMFEA